jgi:hypothetical protein
VVATVVATVVDKGVSVLGISQDVSRLTYAEWRMLMNDTPSMNGIMECLDGPHDCVFGGCDTAKTSYVTECDTTDMCIDTSFRLPPSLLDTINQGSISPVNVNGVSLGLHGCCE